MKILTLLTALFLTGCSFLTLPTVTPNALGTATNASATPAPTPTPTRTPLTDAVADVSAVVLPSAVNIRETAGGPATGKYLYFGDRVEVIGCEGSWCQVEAEISGETVTGYVWRGCLSSVAGSLLCEAK